MSLLSARLSPSVSSVDSGTSITADLTYPPAAFNLVAALRAHVKERTPESYKQGIQNTLEALGESLSAEQALLLLSLPELFSLAHGKDYLLQLTHRLTDKAQPWKFLDELIHLQPEILRALARRLGLEESMLSNRLWGLFNRSTTALSTERLDERLDEIYREFCQASAKFIENPTSEILSRQVASLAVELKQTWRVTPLSRSDSEPHDASQQTYLRVRRSGRPPKKQKVEWPSPFSADLPWFPIPQGILDRAYRLPDQPMQHPVSRLNDQSAPINLIAELYGHDLESGQCSALAVGAAMAALGSETARERGAKVALDNFLSYFSPAAGAEANIVGLSALTDFRRVGENRVSAGLSQGIQAERMLGRSSGDLYEKIELGVLGIQADYEDSIQPGRTFLGYSGTSSIDEILGKLAGSKSSGFCYVGFGAAKKSQLELEQDSTPKHATVLMVRVNPNGSGGVSTKEFIFFDSNSGYILETELSEFKRKLIACFESNPLKLAGEFKPQQPYSFYAIPAFDPNARDILSAIRVFSSPLQVVGPQSAYQIWDYALFDRPNGPGPSINELSRSPLDQNLVNRYRAKITDIYAPSVVPLMKLIEFISLNEPDQIPLLRDPQKSNAILAAVREFTSTEFYTLFESAFARSMNKREFLTQVLDELLFSYTGQKRFSYLSSSSAAIPADDLVASIRGIAEANMILRGSWQNQQLSSGVQRGADQLVRPETYLAWAGKYAPAIAHVFAKIGFQNYSKFVNQPGGMWRAAMVLQASLRIWLAQEARDEERLKSLKNGEVSSPEENNSNTLETGEERIKLIVEQIEPMLQATIVEGQLAHFYRLMIDPLGSNEALAITMNLTTLDVINALSPDQARAFNKGWGDLSDSLGPQRRTHFYEVATLLLFPEFAQLINRIHLALPQQEFSDFSQILFLNNLIRLGYNRDPKRLQALLNPYNSKYRSEEIRAILPKPIQIAEEIPKQIPHRIPDVATLESYIRSSENLDRRKQDVWQDWKERSAAGRDVRSLDTSDFRLLETSEQHIAYQRTCLSVYLDGKISPLKAALETEINDFEFLSNVDPKTVDSIFSLENEYEEAVQWRRTAAIRLHQATHYRRSIREMDPLNTLRATLALAAAETLPMPLFDTFNNDPDQAEQMRRQIREMKALAMKELREAQDLINSAPIEQRQRFEKELHLASLKQKLWFSLGCLESQSPAQQEAGASKVVDKLKSSERWLLTKLALAAMKGRGEWNKTQFNNEFAEQLSQLLGEEFARTFQQAQPNEQQAILHALVADLSVETMHPFTLDTLVQISKAIVRIKKTGSSINLDIAQALSDLREHADRFAEVYTLEPQKLYEKLNKSGNQKSIAQLSTAFLNLFFKEEPPRQDPSLTPSDSLPDDLRIREKIENFAHWAGEWLSASRDDQRDTDWLTELADSDQSLKKNDSLKIKVKALMVLSPYKEGIEEVCTGLRRLSLTQAALLVTLPEIFASKEALPYLKTVTPEDWAKVRQILGLKRQRVQTGPMPQIDWNDLKRGGAGSTLTYDAFFSRLVQALRNQGLATYQRLGTPSADGLSPGLTRLGLPPAYLVDPKTIEGITPNGSGLYRVGQKYYIASDGEVYRVNHDGESGKIRITEPDSRFETTRGSPVSRLFGEDIWVQSDYPGLKGGASGIANLTHSVDAIAEDQTGVSAALAHLEAEQAGHEFNEAITRLVTKEGPGNWQKPSVSLVPLLELAQEHADGSLRIPFVNQEIVGDAYAYLSTRDPEIIQAIQRVRRPLMALRSAQLGVQRPNPETAAAAAAGVSLEHAPTPNTLNTYFFIQGLTQFLGKKSADPRIATDRLLQAHSYVNLAQAVHGLGADIVQVTELVRAGLKGTLSESLEGAGSVIGRVAGEGLGTVLGFVNLGLDVTEVIRNPTAGNISQLTIDAAGLALNLGAVVASAAGAPTLSACLSGPAVILVGLGVGIKGLVDAFKPIREGLENVAHYFSDLNRAYTAGGYRYDTAQKAYVPIANAVVERIGVSGNQIDVKLGSQYLYRTKFGSAGTRPWINEGREGGSPNVVLGIYQPMVLHERERALEIRQQMDNSQPDRTIAGASGSVLFLPDTPKSYLVSHWEILAGSMSRYDDGIDILNRFTRSCEFYSNYYWMGTEHALFKLTPEIATTPVTVSLEDTANHHLVFPKLIAELRPYFFYTVEGNGAQYTLQLEPAARITLQERNPSKGSEWILDARHLASEHIEFTAQGLKVANVELTVPSEARHGKFVVLTKTVGTEQVQQHEIDWSGRTVTVMYMDAALGSTEAGLKNPLQNLAKSGQLHTDYVVIDHLMDGTTPDGKARSVRAFYDVKKARVLFSHPDTPDLNVANEGLIDSDADSAYFTDGQGQIWRTGAQDHQIKARYALLPAEGAQLRCRRVGDRLVVVQTAQETLATPHSRERVYEIDVKTDRIQLSGIQANGGPWAELAKGNSAQTPEALFSQLRLQQALETLNQVSPSAVSSGVAKRPLELSENLFISVSTDTRKWSGWWWRKADQRLIYPRGPIAVSDSTDAASASTLPQQALLWVGSEKRQSSETVYFFCTRTKRLYQQSLQGAEDATLVALPDLELVFESEGQPYAIQKNGVLWGLQDGKFKAIGVHMGKFSAQTDWLAALQKVGRPAEASSAVEYNSPSTPLRLLDIQSADRRPLMAWYAQQQLMVATPPLSGEARYIGAQQRSNSAQPGSSSARKTDGAWCLDGSKLYWQPALAGDKAAYFNLQLLSGPTGNGGSLEVPALTVRASAKLPPAQPFFPDIQFSQVRLLGDTLYGITLQGAVLQLGNEERPRLIGLLDNATVSTKLLKDKYRTDPVLPVWLESRDPQRLGSFSNGGSNVIGWHDVVLEKRFNLGSTEAKSLEWIGYDQQRQVAYFVDEKSGFFHGKAGETENLQRLETGNRGEHFNQTLALSEALGNASATVGTDWKVPLIPGLNYLVVDATGPNGLSVTIDDALWQTYPEMVFNFNHGKGQTHLKLDLPAGQLYLQRWGNDLRIKHRSQLGKMILLRDVYLSQAQATQVALKTTAAEPNFQSYPVTALPSPPLAPRLKLQQDTGHLGDGRTSNGRILLKPPRLALI